MMQTIFYVYVDSPCGNTIIGKYTDLARAMDLKAEVDFRWRPGALWSTRIVQKEVEEIEIRKLTVF